MVLVFMGLLMALSGCTQSPPKISPIYEDHAVVASKPILRFAVHPLHNPDRLNQVFGPLIAHLNSKITGYQFQLEASVNYAAFEKKLEKREVEFALPNPYQTIKSIKYGYKVFAKMGDDENFRGVILVRRDSSIAKIRDLKGKSISYPAPTALAATMLPQLFIFDHGLDVVHATKSLFVGSQESSIMNVYLGVSDAGCTWPPPWKAFVQANPEKAKDLKVIWETSSLPNNGLVARDDQKADLVLRIQNELIHLNDEPVGKQILIGLGLSRFEKATIETYKPVESFLLRFARDVRDPERER